MPKLSGYNIMEITTTRVIRMGFAILQVHIHLKRNLAPYISAYFLPSALLDVLSFGSFFIPATAFPARIALVLTNSLATCVLLRGMKNELPGMHYMTAVEIYLIANLVFIVSVLFQYVLVLHGKCTRQSNQVIPVKDVKKEDRVLWTQLDKICRVTAPIIYIIFNIVYFYRYLSAHSN